MCIYFHAKNLIVHSYSPFLSERNGLIIAIFFNIYIGLSPFFIPFYYFSFSLYALCCFFFLSHDMFYALFFCFLYYKFYGYVCNKTQVYYNIFKIILTLLNMLKFSLEYKYSYSKLSLKIAYNNIEEC